MPFGYEGRNLPVTGSKVIVDAIVNASGGSAKSLKYSWFLEDIFQQNKSGYDKDSFYFYARQGSGTYHTVKLQVFNEDRTIFVEKSIQIPISQPEVIIQKAITKNNRSSFIAKPYFFSADKLTDLIFEWTLPGQEPIISSNYDANVFNLTITGNTNNEITQGDLWLNVKNSQAEEQTANTSMKINIY